MSTVAVACRICGGDLDPISFASNRGVHIGDTPEMELAAGVTGAEAIIARQKASCTAGIEAAALKTLGAVEVVNRWEISGTVVGERYPCRCGEFDAWNHAHDRCPCKGRPDGVWMPKTCCAHIDGPPPPPPSTIAELRDVLIDFELSRPRTMQVELGPSELGTPCVAQMARKIAAFPQQDLTEPAWAPFQGVAVHQQMEDVVAHWNNAIGRQRWIAEADLHINEHIHGHGDAFDVDHDLVVDWKHVGSTALTKLRTARRADKPIAEQVSQEYRVQAHLYGLGHERAGRTVHWVRLVLLARSWRFDDSDEWTEAYSPELAHWALDRYAATVDLLTNLGIDATPDLIAAIPRTPGRGCTWCPFHRPNQRNDMYGCPGDEEAQAAARARISSGLIAPGVTA
jgi:hypothetical protein